jgi:hypothetical protein
MKNIEMEVFRIVRTETADIKTTVLGDNPKMSLGAKYEEIHFKIPYDETATLQVGNVTGHYHGGEYTLMVVDPELFGRFKVGQRIKLG